ncbi:MAG TPA: antibiotic biosynthesis monooxygenase family protein [Anaerolineales bacterium]|nr:antibiotic biosynthesis monooxygenase family protein [Anaerolineales bacterium]
MAKLFVHHKVQDYPAWRKVFDDLTSMRTQFGSTGHQVFRSPSDPNEITILTDWRSLEQAKAYATSPELKDGMKNAGVISQPDVMFLDEA